ncbi:hypothetical protein QW180_05205 [Vibrio sinaloensis]|nr:hypothetical protein [Vibrio sinaloensis]
MVSLPFGGGKNQDSDIIDLTQVTEQELEIEQQIEKCSKTQS